MAPRLRRSDPSSPGITRRACGRGFRYLRPDGTNLVDADELVRIRNLAIPPAWQDVWISPWPNGHLQATGTDQAGRRQYLYHPRWGELRSREKFSRMSSFAERLPELRQHVGELIEGRADEGPTRERVLATAVRLLDRTWLRIGSEQYAAEHGTFGLVTVRRTHLRLEPPDVLEFDFPAKHGIQTRRRIEDPGAFGVIQVLHRRRGGPEALFACRDGRSWKAIEAADVNGFLREAMGIDATAKDFRTWHGTALCAVALASEEQRVRSLGKAPRASASATQREIAAAIRQTSDFLGNTPAVCRSAYVDPRVIDRYRDGRTIQPGIDRLLQLGDLAEVDVQLVVEAATLRLLEDRTPATIARAAARVIVQSAGGAVTAA